MKYYFIYVLLLWNIVLLGQTQTQNYIQTIEPKTPITVADYENSIFVPSVSNSLINISYKDGLGRTVQNIKKGGFFGVSNDLVNFTEYDQFGKVSKNYFPFTTESFSSLVTFNNGAYLTNAKAVQSNYYTNVYSDNTPYSEVVFDGSPLSRVLKSSSGGDAWKVIANSDTDKTKKNVYAVNILSDVKKNVISANTLINNISNYLPGSLIKTTVKNENWISSDGDLNTVQTFTDKSGSKIAEIRFYKEDAIVKKLITEYVYDSKGLLRYVLSPKASEFDYQSFVSSTSRSWSFGKFVTAGNGGGTVTATLNNGVLTLNFNANFAPSTLRTGALVYLDERIPNVNIGTLTCVSCGTNYSLSIKSGYLYMSAVSPTVTTTSLTGAYTVNVGISSFLSNQQFLDKYAHQYIYDDYNRKIEQKTPGRGWEYLVFDKMDRPILTQDANLKAKNEWLYTKYDVYGRVIYTGIYSSTLTRADLQIAADDYISNSGNLSNSEKRISKPNFGLLGGKYLYYDQAAFPKGGSVLTMNYYDNYNFKNDIIPYAPEIVDGQLITSNTEGLLTVSHVSNKIGDLVSWTSTWNYYDEEARPIYINQINHLGGYTITQTKYDFRGKVENISTKHKRTNELAVPELTISDRFTYTPGELILGQYQSINNKPEEVIVNYVYDGLGNIKQKNVGGLSTSIPLQKVKYNYNIRGWLTDINDVNNIGSDLFTYHLDYNVSSFATPTYNGNISGSTWKNNVNNVISPLNAYSYFYDNLNRLTSGAYGDATPMGTNGAGIYNESVTYDINGNIETLKRNGPNSVYPVAIDNLTYTYNGNQLIRIDDSSGIQGFNNGTTSGSLLDDYGYDLNGNFIYDRNKGIESISYNHFDLTEMVTFSNGSKIQFSYDAKGNKLSKVYTTTSGNLVVTDYLGGFQYLNSTLQYFPTAEGYVAKSMNGANEVFTYIYNYTDHLGNVRVSYKGNATLTLDEHFDIGTGGFTSVGSSTLTNTSGSLVTTIPANASLASGSQRLILNNVVAGTRITISGKISNGRFDLGTTGPQAIIVRYDSNGNSTEEIISPAVLRGTFSLEYYVPSAYSSLYLKFVTTTSTASKSFTIDDLLVYTANLQTLSARNYYPYGLVHAGEFISSEASGYNYKFQGKELQTEPNFGYYDFGSRLYEPSIGRWFTPDPQNQFVSPYLAMGNNPVMAIDPDGEWAFWDDVIAMGIGGTINVISNWDNIDSWGDGFAYFGIGAAAGEATLYGGPMAGGLILGAGNNAYQQWSNPSPNGFDAGSVILSGMTGAGSAYIGSFAGNSISGPVNKLFSSIPNQLAREFVSQTTTNVASGVLLGYGSSKVFNTEFDVWSTVKTSLMTSTVSFGIQTLTTKTKGYYKPKSEQEARLKAEKQNQTEENLVYRALTEDQKNSYTQGKGIFAKNPEGNWTVENHILRGSDEDSFYNDPWISTTSEFKIAQRFSGGNGIITIDLNKLPSNSIQVKAYMTNPPESHVYKISFGEKEISIFRHIPQNAIISKD